MAKEEKPGADNTKGKDSANDKALTPQAAAEKKTRLTQRERNLKRKQEIIDKGEKVEIIERRRVKTDDGFQVVEEKKKVPMYTGPAIPKGKFKPKTQREINLANKPAAIKQAEAITEKLKEQEDAKKKLAEANA